MKNKFTHTVKLVIGWSILVLLAVGGIGVIGYIVALIVGGETGAAIVDVINNQFYVWMTRITCGLVVVGMILVYITGEHDFILASKKKKKQPDGTPPENGDGEQPDGAPEADGAAEADSDGEKHYSAAEADGASDGVPPEDGGEQPDGGREENR